MSLISALANVHHQGQFGDFEDKKGDDLLQISEKKNLLIVQIVQFKNSKIPIRIYQQCQKKQNDQLSQFYKKTKINYEIFNFTDKIIDYYSKANLVITRSGASVLAELINFKTPFISFQK